MSVPGRRIQELDDELGYSKYDYKNKDTVLASGEKRQFWSNEKRHLQIE